MRYDGTKGTLRRGHRAGANEIKYSRRRFGSGLHGRHQRRGLMAAAMRASRLTCARAA